MKHIATDVMDSTAKMASMLSAQVTKPGLAMDPYSCHLSGRVNRNYLQELVVCRSYQSVAAQW